MENSTLRKQLRLGLTILGLLPIQFSFAQEKISINISADLVSSYVWRGIKVSDASIQPSMSVNYANFSLSSWASTNVTGEVNYKEVDFTASYKKNGLILYITDYWWDGEDALHYFSRPDQGDGHTLEASLSYQLQNSFPLKLSWNTFLAGHGDKKEDGNNSFSTYIDIEYPFTMANVDMGISTGFTPWKSVIYRTNSFEFTSIQIKASKNIKVTDSYSLPVFGSIITNPHLEDIHFVFGITIN